MQTKQEELFTKAPVWKAIFTMAVPAMVTMLVMILYNMADMFFVGQTGDTAQVAAVSLVGPVFTVMMAIGNMLGGGGCALLSRTLGEKNTENLRLYSSLCFWGSIVFGILFFILTLAGRPALLAFLGANDEIRDYAQTYLTVLSFGAPVMILSTTLSAIVRAEGAVKLSMVGNLLSTLTNIVLDPVFILVLRMGVGGAAIATVIGNAAGVVFYCFYIQKGGSVFTMSIRPALKNPLAIGRILAIGLPNAISNVLSGFASAFANQLLIGYGTLAVAAMAAAGKAPMIVAMIQMGITMGVQPLLGYSYGAHDLPRLKELIKKLSALTILIGLSVTLLCLVFGDSIVALFLKDESALALGQSFVRLLMLSGPFLGLYYLSSTFLQAAGNASLATLVTLLRQGILLIPLLYAMNALFGMYGNIYAQLVSDILASVLGITLALWQYRKLIKVVR